MQLVVDLDDLKTVGFAVRENRHAFEAVQRLIGGSPTLADVMGVRAAGEAPEITTADQVEELLEDQTWHPTVELAKTLKLTPATVLRHLKAMEAVGKVERRMDGKPRRAEWRLTD